MTRIVNYWPDPLFKKRGGVDGVVTLTTNAWWTLPDLPAGRYRIVTESAGLSAFVIHRYPEGQISNMNSQLSNPRQTVMFTIDSPGVIFQPMLPSGRTATISKLMIIDADQWEPLKTLMGEEIPYFDNRTMPLP
ncbi:hypothetical protein [uncultured Bifidobacterium sp.]|uniref:hypothetical protein n=1 Tax=uncultured Bifidobacterium sp. TaxID=165187 RepID=UPI00258F2DB0|nr:hypothetical protein [uncultured Bifidobacterium sp.]